MNTVVELVIKHAVLNLTKVSIFRTAKFIVATKHAVPVMSTKSVILALLGTSSTSAQAQIVFVDTANLIVQDAVDQSNVLFADVDIT